MSVIIDVYVFESEVMMGDFLDILSSVPNKVGNSEVFYRGCDSGVLRLNVFDSGVKHVYYTKKNAEILIGGDYWVCVELYPPEDESEPVRPNRLMARFVRKERL